MDYTPDPEPPCRGCGEWSGLYREVKKERDALRKLIVDAEDQLGDAACDLTVFRDALRRARKDVGQ